MVHYDIVLKLTPPRLFGLPEEGMTIIEAGPRQVTSPSIDPRTENVVGHGTLSQFRHYDERLTAAFTLNAVQVTAEDNFFRVALEASDVRSAVSVTKRELSRLCAITSVLSGTFLSFDILQIVEDGDSVSMTESVPVMRVHTYDVERLQERLIKASGLLDGLPPDQRLDQALRYLTDAGTLYQLMIEGGMERLLAPFCFLQFWKALATVVGDPSNDRDHQSRYRQFGLDKADNDYYRRVLLPLHTIRNQFDVAHIASLQEPEFVIWTDVSRCRTVALEAIQAYIEFLQRFRPGHDPTPEL